MAYKNLAGLLLASAGLLGVLLTSSGLLYWLAAALCAGGIALSALPLMSAGGSDTRALAQILSVCAKAATGHIEARIVLLPACQPLIRDCANRINALLDLTEVFCKEADTAMQYANRRKYFRKIILTGMPGDFARHSRTINSTLDNMRERDLAALEFAEQHVNVLVHEVKTMASSLKGDACAMAGDAEVTARNATGVAKDATDTSSSMQTVAAATEELSGSFAEVARQTVVARDASANAVREGESRKNDVLRLKDLAESIRKATQLIDGIARQTNLLALNATIEAAHAGESGKGFAVVAQEIKLLADQTTQATQDIGKLIKDIHQLTGETANGIISLNTIMSDIEQISMSVASAAEEQTAVTRDITKNIIQVADASGRISTSITDVRNIADNCETKTHNVMTAIVRMEGLCSELEKELGRYIGEIDFRAKPAA